MSDDRKVDPAEVDGISGDGSPEVDFANVADPFPLFEDWYRKAQGSEPNDPNAMALASVDATGLPNVRMVLLKGLDGEDVGPSRGFVFYTNLESAKGVELAGQPKAALVFHWKSLSRQVRARGTITPVSDAEADVYFASRPRGSQLGAWASAQSRPLTSKAKLAADVAKLTAQHAVGEIPRPPHWSGFRLTPSEVEFWQAGTFRLHDRRRFERIGADAPWTSQRLYP